MFGHRLAAVARHSGVFKRGQQVRNLNIHEYASMEVMKSFDVPTPRGIMAENVDDVGKAFQELGEEEVVIKAQSLTGGRGKGSFKNGFQGGVHVTKGEAETKDVASKMLGQILVTKQTGEEGKPCGKVFLMEKLDLKREMYFSILMDRAHNGPTMVGSPCGGMNIEDVAAETPEKIFTESIDVMTGIKDEQVERMAKNLGCTDPETIKQAKAAMTRLYDMFIATDSTLVEINPLGETSSGDIFCCDAKLNFDDNAEFRQEKVFDYRDRSQEDIREVEAAKYGLNYIGLFGSIGCLVNGAGLAMATMDIIKLNGGEPANFLDVGGGATKDQVQKAFEILNEDQKVKAIFVNIFGGIMRCDIIAAGVVAAAKEIGLEKPIVIRLQGTNSEEAKDIINNSGIAMTMTDDLDEGARIAAEIANA